MIIPKKLTIGAHTYRVVLEGWDNSANECGRIDREKGIIQLDPALQRSILESSLLHEILHGINSELDHALLDSLAEQLYQVLSQNKMLR